MAEKNREHIYLMIISVVGFMVMFILGGGVRSDLGDSPGYIHFNSVAPPLYPTFLWIMRLIIGESWYLQGVAILQNILGAFSIWYLTITVKKHFYLNRTMSVVVLGLAYLPHVVTPLVSLTHFVITNAILSEGISVSLYYIWSALLINIVFEKKYSKYYWAVILAVMMILTRKQLFFVLAVMFLVWCYLSSSHNIKKIIYSLAALLLGIVMYFACTYIYLHTLSKPIMSLTYDSGRTSAVMFNADTNDKDIMHDADTKELFCRIYQKFEDNSISYVNENGTIVENSIYQESCYDFGAELVLEAVEEYSVSRGVIDADEQILLCRKKLKEIRQILYKNNWRRQLGYSLNYVVQGMIRTISTTKSILNGYAFFMYGMAAVLMFWLFKMDKDSKSSRLMLMILILILGNVCSTALVIMCLSRYMIYNMSIFYIAGLMMMKEFIEKALEKRIK